MATLAVLFTIVESADGTYFTFVDTTGDSPTNPTGWGCDAIAKNTTTNPMRLRVGYNSTNYYYTFANFAELASVDISPNELLDSLGVALGVIDSTFTDGTYSFQLQIYVTGAWSSAYDLVATVEGFAAVITASTIKEMLNYRTYLDLKTKEGLMEKNRLLNNLAYSASIGSTQYFEENLQALQSLQ